MSIFIIQRKIREIFIIFVKYTKILVMAEPLNRIKVVLAEKQKTNKWLAEKLGKDQTTVSKWCTNKSQPGIETLFKMA